LRVNLTTRKAVTIISENEGKRLLGRIEDYSVGTVGETMHEEDNTLCRFLISRFGPTSHMRLAWVYLVVEAMRNPLHSQDISIVSYYRVFNAWLA